MGGGSSSRGGGASLSQGKLLDAASAAAVAAGMGDASSSSAGLYTELLPAGCAPDAYKLFVGNVPKTFTEEELRPVRWLWRGLSACSRVVHQAFAGHNHCACRFYCAAKQGGSSWLLQPSAAQPLWEA